MSIAKMKKVLETFAKRLRDLRLEKGLSQRTVADFLQISQPSYIRYELRTGEPSLETLAKLAGFFQVSAGYLLGLEEY